MKAEDLIQNEFMRVLIKNGLYAFLSGAMLVLSLTEVSTGLAVGFLLMSATSLYLQVAFTRLLK